MDKNDLEKFLASIGEDTDLLLDGEVHQLRSADFKGWYKGSKNESGRCTVTVASWRGGAKNFYVWGGEAPSAADWEAEKERREAADAERERLQLEASKSVIKRIDQYLRENWGGHSKYLERKKIPQALGAIQIESPSVGTDLIVPMQDSQGNIWNYQTITESGMKTFVPGAKVRGLWACLSPSSYKEEAIFICEGYSTACTVAMARPNDRVICAFSAGNLCEVAAEIRKQNLGAKIIICADDDWKETPNVGVEAGARAAELISGTLVLPVFPKARGLDWTDFNDLMCGYSLSMVEGQLELAVSRAARPTDEWQRTFQTVEELVEKGTKQALAAADGHIKAASGRELVAEHTEPGLEPLPMKLSKSGVPIMPPEYEVAKALANFYKDRIVSSEGSIFVFSGTHWVEMQIQDENRLRMQLQVLYSGLASNTKMEGTLRIFRAMIKDSPRNLFVPDPTMINLLNGTIHILQRAGKWQFDFRPHARKDFCTNLIPIEFDETRKIKNTEFEQMLERVFEGQEDSVEKIKTVRQMYGAAVAPIFPHLFMIYGPAGSGKTSLIIPAQKLVSSGNWCSVEPHEFDGFKMESMAGKLVNFVTDISVTEPIRDNHIKKIEDGLPIRIDRKFKTSVMAPLPRVHIFGGNDIPATFEKGSRAHERRWTFLKVEGFQAIGNYSKFFATEVFDACPTGVLNFALDGLTEVLEANGHYFTPDSGKKKMRQWQMEHDPVALFINEIMEGEIVGWRVSNDPACKVLRSAVWEAFIRWYEAAYNRKPRIGKIKFYEAFSGAKLPGAKFEVSLFEGQRYFKGLCVNDSVDAAGRF